MYVLAATHFHLALGYKVSGDHLRTNTDAALADPADPADAHAHAGQKLDLFSVLERLEFNQGHRQRPARDSCHLRDSLVVGHLGAPQPLTGRRPGGEAQ